MWVVIVINPQHQNRTPPSEKSPISEEIGGNLEETIIYWFLDVRAAKSPQGIWSE